MGGGKGDIKVLVVKLPEMEVIVPDVLNWTTRWGRNAGYAGTDASGSGAGGEPQALSPSL
jgi:hypothetical protein